MNFLFLCLLVLFLILGFVIGAFNITPQVTVNLIYREFLDIPLGTVMIGSMIAGMAMAALLGLFEVLRLRVQCRQLRRQIKSLKEGQPRSWQPEPAETPPISISRDEETQEGSIPSEYRD